MHICMAVSPEITCFVHVLKAMRMLGECGKGVIVEDLFTGVTKNWEFSTKVGTIVH